MLPPGPRRVVLAYYRFARQADDLADCPTRPKAEKCALLLAEKRALEDGHHPISALLAEHAIPLTTATDLLESFLADVSHRPCASWEDLRQRCRWSARPVGRFLLALCGEESERAAQASDSLCDALQILNHLQGCGEDWKTLNRCFLPADWLAETGATRADLGQAHCSPALRQTLDRVLDATETLLGDASPLPDHLRNRFLRAQAVATRRVAQALARRLRRGDPLAAPIRPTGLDWGTAAWEGLTKGLLPMGRR